MKRATLFALVFAAMAGSTWSQATFTLTIIKRLEEPRFKMGFNFRAPAPGLVSTLVTPVKSSYPGGHEVYVDSDRKMLVGQWAGTEALKHTVQIVDFGDANETDPDVRFDSSTVKQDTWTNVSDSRFSTLAVVPELENSLLNKIDLHVFDGSDGLIVPVKNVPKDKYIDGLYVSSEVQFDETPGKEVEIGIDYNLAVESGPDDSFKFVIRPLSGPLEIGGAVTEGEECYVVVENMKDAATRKVTLHCGAEELDVGVKPADLGTEASFKSLIVLPQAAADGNEGNFLFFVLGRYGFYTTVERSAVLKGLGVK